MRIREEDKKLIKQALEIIELNIKKKENPCNIKRKVVMKAGYCDRHFDRLFRAIMGCSLTVYIKHEMYINAYECWKKEKRNLTQREVYNGIPYFLFYFKRRYGCSINEINEDEIKLQRRNEIEEAK